MKLKKATNSVTEESEVIRSSNLSLKFANSSKLTELSLFLKEYRRVTVLFIDMFWPVQKLKPLADKKYTEQVETWLTARAVQAAAKQASSIVRGTRQKHLQRIYVYERLLEAGNLVKAVKLKAKIDKTKMSKPELHDIHPDLDSRFVKIEATPNETSFDYWLTLTCLGNEIKLVIPLKSTKHVNELLEIAKLKTSIKLYNNKVSFLFELPVSKNTSNTTVGIDLGVNAIFSCSNGTQVVSDSQSHSLDSITDKLARKKRGSVNFRQASEHRNNFVNWSIKQLNLQNIKTLKLENLDFRYETRSRKESHFNYGNIFDKLEQTCNKFGVQIVTVNPAFTSQRCSRCGWVCSESRNSTFFNCVKCNFALNSDVNAAINISLNLTALFSKFSKKQKKYDSKAGFYWLEKASKKQVTIMQLGSSV